jgi:hypothetical protein
MPTATRCSVSTASRVFFPDPDEVAFARRVIEAIPDGRGVLMIDGNMQDDATWKQCRVMVDLPRCSPPATPSSPSMIRVRVGGCWTRCEARP